MNVYLRRFMHTRSTTAAERSRARMLSARTHTARTEWLAYLYAMQRLEAHHREVTQLRADLAETRAQVSKLTRGDNGMESRIGRLERASFRRDGWWKAEPRVEAFVRKSVAELRQEGFSDVVICCEILLGLSLADMSTIPRAA